MTFKIEKGVPLPPKRSASKYPFKEMGVGDSIFVDGKDGPKAVRAAYIWGRRNNVGMAARREHNGHRIWRVK